MITQTFDITGYTKMCLPSFHGSYVAIAAYYAWYPSASHFGQFMIFTDTGNNAWKIIYCQDPYPVDISAFYINGADLTKLEIRFFGKVPPIQVVTGASGGWQAAARVYKDWMTANAKFYKRKANPTSLRLKYLLNGATNTASYLQTHSLENAAVWDHNETAVFATNYRTNAYDTKYPDYTPNTGFGAAFAAIKAAGVEIIPYLNGCLWDSTESTYSLANMVQNAGAAISYNGTLPNLKFSKLDNNFISRLAAEHNKMSVAIGKPLDTVYLDVVCSVIEPRANYFGDTSDSSSWITGTRNLLDAFSSKYVMAEFPAEIYLDKVNASLTYAVPDANSVGLYGFLYKDVIDVGCYQVTPTDAATTLSYAQAAFNSLNHSFHYFNGDITTDNNLITSGYSGALSFMQQKALKSVTPPLIKGIKRIVSADVINRVIKYSGYGVWVTNGNTVNIANCVFDTSTQSGPAIQIDSGSTVTSDYNVFTTEYSGMFSKNGATYNTLAAWQAATGNDLHSSVGAVTYDNKGNVIAGADKTTGKGTIAWQSIPRTVNASGAAFKDSAPNVGCI